MYWAFLGGYRGSLPDTTVEGKEEAKLNISQRGGKGDQDETFVEGDF